MVNLIENQKKVSVNVLAFSDISDTATGAKSRSWKQTTVTYRIIDETKYESMSLSVSQTFHKSQTLAPQKAVRVFLHTNQGEFRGECVQEICSNDQLEGIITEIAPLKSISNDEVIELLKSGKPFQVRMIQGKALVLPAVYEEQ